MLASCMLGFWLHWPPQEICGSWNLTDSCLFLGFVVINTGNVDQSPCMASYYSICLKLLLSQFVSWSNKHHFLQQQEGPTLLFTASLLISSTLLHLCLYHHSTSSKNKIVTIRPALKAAPASLSLPKVRSNAAVELPSRPLGTQILCISHKL